VWSLSLNLHKDFLGTKVHNPYFPLCSDVNSVDVFLSKYHLNNLASPKRLSNCMESGSYRVDAGLGSSDDGRDEDFVDVHEIHIENDHTEPWWDDLA
jgi:hypothetical protein